MVDAVMFDIDGVLTTSWEPLPGAVDAVRDVRERELRVAFVTNTTSRSAASVASSLRGAGVELADHELLTATVATAEHLGQQHPGRACLVLNDGDAGEDLAGLPRAASPESAAVVVVGGAGPAFTYDAVDDAFRALAGGAALVAMHRNLRWRTNRGEQLDAGAFVLGLEAAAETEATVVGKPSPEFFAAGLRRVDAPAQQTVMVGDDLHSDVLAAQALGCTGVLVRTGKFRQEELDRSEEAPDHVIDGVGELPDLLDHLSG